MNDRPRRYKYLQQASNKINLSRSPYLDFPHYLKVFQKLAVSKRPTTNHVLLTIQLKYSFQVGNQCTHEGK